MKSPFSSNIFFHKSNNQVAKRRVQSGGKDLWVLSRGLCLFTNISLKGKTSAEIKSELNLYVRQLGPFESPEAYVVLRKDKAMIWLWNGDEVNSSMQESKASNALVVPETLLVEPKDGLNLIKNLDGYEAQWWNNDELLLSKWWPKKPSEDELKWFLKTNEFAPDIVGGKEFVEVELQDKPWASSVKLHAGKSVINEKFLILSLCFFTGFLLCYQAAELLKVKSVTSKLEKEKVHLTSKVKPFLEQRDKTTRDISLLNEYAKINQFPAQLSMWHIILKEVMAKKGEIVKWNFQGNSLRVLISAKSNLDPKSLIKIFEAHDYFQGVIVERGHPQGYFNISMKVNTMISLAGK